MPLSFLGHCFIKRGQQKSQFIFFFFSKFHEIDSYQQQIEFIWQGFSFLKLSLTFSSKMLLIPQILSPIQIAESMNLLGGKKKLPTNRTSGLALSCACERLVLPPWGA